MRKLVFINTKFINRVFGNEPFAKGRPFADLSFNDSSKLKISRGGNFMQNNNDNERSTASKIIWGTWLTNGLVIAVFGFIVLLVGLSGNWYVGDLGPGALTGIGAFVLIAGIACVGVHYAKKKN
ncbi:MAG: hypothetical protein LBC71_07155 [Oscillospiraceae bacterium]|jgi:hypothetical protein|nr:hypothetical protein [Oscillospiraceae bacterium]